MSEKTQHLSEAEKEAARRAKFLSDKGGSDPFEVLHKEPGKEYYFGLNASGPPSACNRMKGVGYEVVDSKKTGEVCPAFDTRPDGSIGNHELTLMKIDSDGYWMRQERDLDLAEQRVDRDDAFATFEQMAHAAGIEPERQLAVQAGGQTRNRSTGKLYNIPLELATQD